MSDCKEARPFELVVAAERRGIGTIEVLNDRTRFDSGVDRKFRGEIRQRTRLGQRYEEDA